MKKSKFTEAQRKAIVAKQKEGESVEKICRDYQISAATFYKWKNGFIANENAQKKRLKQLELENGRLKKMYSELSMNYEILEEGYLELKKWQAQTGKSN